MGCARQGVAAGVLIIAVVPDVIDRIVADQISVLVQMGPELRCKTDRIALIAVGVDVDRIDRSGNSGVTTQPGACAGTQKEHVFHDLHASPGISLVGHEPRIGITGSDREGRPEMDVPLDPSATPGQCVCGGDLKNHARLGTVSRPIHRGRRRGYCISQRPVTRRGGAGRHQHRETRQRKSRPLPACRGMTAVC